MTIPLRRSNVSCAFCQTDDCPKRRCTQPLAISYGVTGALGGQQQRVAIARSLANNPSIVVADEPTGNLDSKTSTDVISLFKHLVKAGKTMVMVTHDNNLAAQST